MQAPASQAHFSFGAWIRIGGIRNRNRLAFQLVGFGFYEFQQIFFGFEFLEVRIIASSVAVDAVVTAASVGIQS